MDSLRRCANDRLSTIPLGLFPPWEDHHAASRNGICAAFQRRNGDAHCVPQNGYTFGYTLPLAAVAQWHHGRCSRIRERGIQLRLRLDLVALVGDGVARKHGARFPAVAPHDDRARRADRPSAVHEPARPLRKPPPDPRPL